jgi:hypothetical protein
METRKESTVEIDRAFETFLPDIERIRPYYYITSHLRPLNESRKQNSHSLTI